MYLWTSAVDFPVGKARRKEAIMGRRQGHCDVVLRASNANTRTYRGGLRGGLNQGETALKMRRTIGKGIGKRQALLTEEAAESSPFMRQDDDPSPPMHNQSSDGWVI
jgi:hypothetical protein